MPHESSTICHLPYAVSQLPRAQWYRKHGSVTVSLPLLFGTHSFLAVLWQGSVSCLIQVAYTLSCFLRSDSEKLEYSFKQPPKLNVFSFEDTYLRLNSLNFRGKKERERNLMSFSLRLWVFWICWLGCAFFCLFCFLFFTMSVACGHSRVRNQTRATWATAVTTWQHLILNALHHQGTPSVYFLRPKQLSNSGNFIWHSTPIHNLRTISSIVLRISCKAIFGILSSPTTHFRN